MSSGGDGKEPAKPKFRPKAQARKKPAAATQPAVDDYRAGIESYRSGWQLAGGADGGDGSGGGQGGYRDSQIGRGRRGRGFEGRGHRQWDDRSRGRGGGRGRGRDSGFRGGGAGRGRGGFVPVGQDFFVGGGGSGPVAYVPSGVSIGGSAGLGGSGGRVRGGGDTSESEADDAERKKLTRSNKDASSERKLSAAAGGKGKVEDSGARNEGADDDDDEDMFGVGGWADEEGEEEEDRGAGGAGAPGDLFSLMGAPGPNRHRSKSAKIPGMKITGNVMSEEDGMRPVALPVTATAQDPTGRLFARADNEAELEEEEDSSLFFVQLPTKLPRPLPAFQRRSRATGGAHSVKAELSDAAAAGSGTGGGASAGGAAGPAAGGKGKAAAETAAFKADDMAFDQGLRRMKPGKIGKLYVHKSGHARLVIGGVSLSVQSGLAVSFVEEGVSIDAGSQKSFCSFGQVTKRAVCTPDFEQLYRRAQEDSGQGGGTRVGAGGVAGSGVRPVKMELE